MSVVRTVTSRAALALTLISTSITVLPTESNLLGTISINCESTSSESAAKDGLNDVVREKVFKVSGFGAAPQVCTLL